MLPEFLQLRRLIIRRSQPFSHPSAACTTNKNPHVPSPRSPIY
jgi:hypothetical protein